MTIFNIFIKDNLRRSSDVMSYFDHEEANKAFMKLCKQLKLKHKNILVRNDDILYIARAGGINENYLIKYKCQDL